MSVERRPPPLSQEQQRYRIGLWHSLIAVQQAHFGHASQDVKLALCRRMAAAYSSELQAHQDAQTTRVLGRRLDYLLLERFFRCIVNVMAQQQQHLDFVLEADEEDEAASAAGSPAAATGATAAEPKAQALSIVMASNTVMLEFAFVAKLNDALGPGDDLVRGYKCPVEVSVEVDSEEEADQAQAEFLGDRIKTCLAQQDFGLLQVILSNFFEQKLLVETAAAGAEAEAEAEGHIVFDGVSPGAASLPPQFGLLITAPDIQASLAADPILGSCAQLRLLQPQGSDLVRLGLIAQPELVYARSQPPSFPHDFVAQATSRRCLHFWPPVVMCNETLALSFGEACAAAIVQTAPAFDLDSSGSSQRPALSSRPLSPESFATCAPHLVPGAAGERFVRDCAWSDQASGVVLNFFARDTWFCQARCVERLEFPANAPLPADWFPRFIRGIRRQITFNALVQPRFRPPGNDWATIPAAAPTSDWQFSLSAEPPRNVFVAAHQISTDRRWVCEFQVLDEPSPSGGAAAQLQRHPHLFSMNPFVGSLCNRVLVRISSFPRTGDGQPDENDIRMSKVAERVLAVTLSLPQTLKHVFVLRVGNDQ